MAQEGGKAGLDSVKRSRGLLSFRSRKLVNGLLKTPGVNEVDKSAALQTVEASLVEEKDVHQAKPSEERNNACGELWNPMKVESDSARARSLAQSRKMSKQLTANEKNGKEAQLLNGGGASAKRLPPKLKLLETFYEGLEAATSLLRIRHQMCTFTAVRKIVESMSRRRFLPKNLAQMKHIFSEELHLEYVRCQDPDTWGEKWDLRITLLPLSSHSTVSDSPLKGSAGQTAQAVRRRKEFRARLLKFASSHPEEGDVPLGPLPQRPLGGKLPNSSYGGLAQPTSARDVPFDSSAQGSGDGQPAPRAESSTADEDSFHFTIVKRPRDECSVHHEGTLHFPSSFKPFFSVQHEVVEGISHEDGEGSSHEAGEGTPHFPASFRPFFSLKRTAGDDPVPLVPESSESYRNCPPGGSQFSEDRRPDETLRQGPSCKVHDSSTESTVPHVFKELDDDSTQLNTDGRFSASFRPVFSLLSSDQSFPSSGISAQSSPASASRFSPAPAQTPSVLSPMNHFRAVQNSPSESQMKSPSTISSSRYSEVKCQGTMRSLKFGSPARSHPAQATDSDSSPETRSSIAEMNFAQMEKSETRETVLAPPSSPPSTPTVPLKNVPSRSPLSVFTPPPTPANTSLEKSSLLSPLKNSKARSLQFSTPVKVFGKSSAAEVCGLDTPEHATSSTSCGSAAKPPRSVSHSKCLPSNSPSTPALRTPVRAPRSQETLYSPPKRTKLNRVSLFAKVIDEKDHQKEILSEARVASETITNSVAIAKGDAVIEARLDTVSVVRKATAAVKVLKYPTSEDIKGISESDLEIIQCLPLDLVQSVREKEMKIKDESSREVAKEKRRQQMIGGLSKLLNQLRLIFQSLNRSVMPRNELVKNILRSHPDISDKGEIEERLQLLTELAPDWMTTRPSQTGDLLYRIDKRADVVRIQRRLSAASDAVC